MIVVAATFVAEPLQEPLTLVLTQAGCADTLAFAPYHQVFQELLTPDSLLTSNASGINVLLLRLQDFVREQEDPLAADAMIQRTAAELGAALAGFAARLKGALLLALLPPGPDCAAAVATTIIAAGQGLAEHARGLPGIHWIDAATIESLGPPTDLRYDPVRDRLAHIPYGDGYFAALALALGRRIHALKVPPAKVLVLDCDHTLWRGVVGEDGVQGIDVTPSFRAIQEFAVARQSEGVLVCLASKNAEADVLAVFAEHPAMVLQMQHVVAHRINWLPKASNLRSLANELNLGLDAFVFLDDNPVECGRMREELPQVITLQVPEETQVAAFLANLWPFDKLAVTAEDAQRTRMYRENTARRALESSVGDIGQFLAALELKIDIAAPDSEEWARFEQLTHRTNQFNFTTRRRTAAEFRAMQSDGAVLARVRVADRFGDYGLVGALVAMPDHSALRVDTLLLSCRVLGRGVEHAMLRWLAEEARSRGLAQVELPWLSTPRNEPARAFADSVAGAFAQPLADGMLFAIPVEHGLAIAHRPGEDPDAVVQARLADDKKGTAPASPAGTAPGRSEHYQRLALELCSGAAVQAALAAQARRPRTLVAPAEPAATAAEVRLQALWQEVLGVEMIGVTDDYFALGGTSLMSVPLFAEIDRQFGVQLRLTTILAAPTIRLLALQLQARTGTLPGSLVTLRSGGSRTLFLVHDGLGETLLYLNLARRLPGQVTVCGIEPRRLAGIPLAHASIEEMAGYYVEQIRAVQAHGPYLIGGMCAGGVIAYQMAAILVRSGETVERVLILDGATPQAPRRGGRIARQRVARLQGLLAASAGTPTPRWQRGVQLGARILGKAANVMRYEAGARWMRLSARLRFALLKALVRRDRAWPAWLPELSVAQIYSQLEARYQPPVLPEVPVLLVRASVGVDADTPYREIYRDADFGWQRVAGRLELADVTGGHASMLQEQHVDALCMVLRRHLERWAGATGDPAARMP